MEDFVKEYLEEYRINLETIHNYMMSSSDRHKELWVENLGSIEDALSLKKESIFWKVALGKDLNDEEVKRHVMLECSASDFACHGHHQVDSKESADRYYKFYIAYTGNEAIEKFIKNLK
ncbi:hypothetical protein GW765_01145 [Candidatus Parcubacteria bacterium]|nr:hypothetical protein [Candidatus Parcubacteria bacterium]